MSGRMVDVEGLEPAVVLVEAATRAAYGDTPAERVALIRSWLASKDATRAEVEDAVALAHREALAEDEERVRFAQAVVVLSAVLRTTPC